MRGNDPSLRTGPSREQRPTPQRRVRRGPGTPRDGLSVRRAAALSRHSPAPGDGGVTPTLTSPAAPPAPLHLTAAPAASARPAPRDRAAPHHRETARERQSGTGGRAARAGRARRTYHRERGGGGRPTPRHAPCRAGGVPVGKGRDQGCTCGRGGARGVGQNFLGCSGMGGVRDTCTEPPPCPPQLWVLVEVKRVTRNPPGHRVCSWARPEGRVGNGT